MAKKKQPDDTELFGEIQARAQQIVSSFGARDAMLTRLDEMYLLEWADAPKEQEGIKLTKAPDGRNTVRGVVNLMTATSPEFTVPQAVNTQPADSAGEQIEKWAAALWAASNSLQQVAVERDVAHSLALYDEAYIAITCTRDLSKAASKRAETAGASWMDEHIHQAADEAPYIYSIVSPHNAYPMQGRTGLLAYVQKEYITVAEVRERFGSLATDAIGTRKMTDILEVREYWDGINHAVWLHGHAGQKVILGRHELGFIPISMRVANGTRLYREPERQRQPLLYTMLESGLWARKNSLLTAMFHRLAALGLNAQFVHRMGSPDAEINLDFSKMGGIIDVEPGGDLRLLAESIVDPNILVGLNTLNGMLEDSSVYRQAFGAPVAGTDTFATLSLLSQAGRLPLVPIQEGAKDLLSRTMQLTMRWIKNDGEKQSVYQGGETYDIDPAQIPERLVIDTILDVDLPQDMLRNANIASMLKRDALVDDRWIHENILKIGQTKNMRKRIVAQQVADMLIARTIKQYMQSLEPQQPPAPPQGGPQQGPPPGPGGPGFNPAAGGMAPAEAGMMGQEQAPPGYHVMPDGQLMADNEMPPGGNGQGPM